MKKILSSILCLSMIASMGTVAFAAETNTHEIIYQNEPHYEIIIPDSSNIDVSTGKGTIDVSVGDANLAEGTMVAITASSSNYNNGSWNLINIKNSEDAISYSIGTTDGDNDIDSGDRVLATSETSDVTLYITVNDTGKVGTFTDIITFTSEIVKETISFSIGTDDMSYDMVVPNGMTWAEWVNSEYNELGAVDDNGALFISGKGYLFMDNNGYSAGFELDDEIIDGGRYYFTYNPPL